MAVPARSRALAVAVGTAAAAAALALLLGGGWLARVHLPGGPSEQTGPDRLWRVLPETFPVTYAWLSGPFVILPDPRSCFVALGRDNLGTGTVAGFWRSDQDCTTAVRTAPTPEPAGGGPAGSEPPGGGPPAWGSGRSIILAAVPAHGGGYLAVQRRTFEGDAFAYESRVLHGEPQHPDPARAWRQLAEFHTDTPRASHIGPVALATTADGYVAVGRNEELAVAWTSPDGAGWRQVRLPDAGLGERPRVSDVVVGPDGTVVAVGAGGSSGYTDQVAGWVSRDGGASWEQARMPDGGEEPTLTTVVHTGGEFVALGSREGSVLDPALVLTSPDGLVWHRDDGLAGAGGGYVQTATVLPDGQVLAVSAAPGEASGPDQRCAAVWRWDPAGWQSEPLGCHGVPTSLAVLPDGSVAGVHWSTLFLRAPPAL